MRERERERNECIRVTSTRFVDYFRLYKNFKKSRRFMFITVRDLSTDMARWSGVVEEKKSKINWEFVDFLWVLHLTNTCKLVDFSWTSFAIEGISFGPERQKPSYYKFRIPLMTKSSSCWHLKAKADRTQWSLIRWP